MLELLPGDALTRTLSPDQIQQLTEYQLEQAREARGLNDPMLVRYFRWMGFIPDNTGEFIGMLQGEFGHSFSHGQDIGKMLGARLPYTIELAGYGLIVATVFGLILGFLAAIFKNTIIDYICNFIAVIFVSLPEFFYGVCLVVLFAATLGWLPSGGRMPSTADYTYIDRIPYMVMPVLAMGTSLIAALLKYTRSSMLDVLGKDYIKTARSKGLREPVINIKHAFRNALSPVMTLMVMRLPMLVGGSVVIEQVFNYHGIGTMALTASKSGDQPVVMITTLISTIMTLLASTLVDLSTALLDPRVRFE